MILKLRKVSDNEKANVDMVLTAVIAGVMFAIAIPIIFSVMAGIDTSAIDGNVHLATSTPAQNASTNLLSNVETFFTIGPIYIVVVAAVGIIAAILLLRGR